MENRFTRLGVFFKGMHRKVFLLDIRPDTGYPAGFSTQHLISLTIENDRQTLNGGGDGVRTKLYDIIFNI
jgi:hypothetical protein